MKKYSINFIGPINLKKFEGKTYPERKVMFVEHGTCSYNKFYATVTHDDALLDLQKGDVVRADVIFGVEKVRGKWQQTAHFYDLCKINENQKK